MKRTLRIIAVLTLAIASTCKLWWGAIRPVAAPNGNPNPADSCPYPRTMNTVDLSSGVKIEAMTDIAFGGARGGIMFGHGMK